MPYIEKKRRAEIKGLGRQPKTAGELNYKLTVLALEYLETHGECYQTYAEIVSSFECAKLEMYRRMAAPYEDKKATENGEVYPI
jgi:hypothetical protein